MAIQGTQVLKYTKHTLLLYFSDFSIFVFLKNKIRKIEKQPNKIMLNKVKHKTRCRCMREEEERKRSPHGDNTNVLTKEFKVLLSRGLVNRSPF